MAIGDVSIYENLVAPTPPEGATPLTLGESPNTVVSGRQFLVTNDADFATRRTVTFKVKPSTYDPKTKRFSKQKRTIVVACPKTDIDNNIIFPALEINLSMPADYDQTDINYLRAYGIWLLGESSLDSFFVTGVVPS